MFGQAKLAIPVFVSFSSLPVTTKISKVRIGLLWPMLLHLDLFKLLLYTTRSDSIL